MTQRKERPILFSGPMVRAILDGRKTQTRRIVTDGHFRRLGLERDGDFIFTTEGPQWNGEFEGGIPYCPYGKPGDRLWVRETFRLPVTFDNQSPSEVGRKCVESGYSRPWCPIQLAADGYTYCEHMLGDFGGDWGKTRVSIHMPRWMSRMTLEIASVRVERLQDISEADAMAEGCERIDLSPREINGVQVHPLTSTYFAAFAELWRSINGHESWGANPWVWVVEFFKVDALTEGGDA